MLRLDGVVYEGDHLIENKLSARRARASARTVHAPRGKPRFIVLRTPHALRLIGGMQTPGLCCGHRQRPMHELILALVLTLTQPDPEP